MFTPPSPRASAARAAHLIILMLIISAGAGLVNGQSGGPASPPGPVVKYSNLILTVGNLERSVAFYRDRLGLELLSMSRRPTGDKIVNPYVAKVSGSPPETVFGSAILRLPGAGFNLLLTEFTNVDRAPREPDVRELGTAAVILSVRDVDRLLQDLKSAGARIVTPGGAPADLGDRSRAVVVRDPDGFLIELIERRPATGDASLGNVVSAHVQITVSRVEKSREFYRRMLGFEFPAAPRSASDASMEMLWGAHAGASRRFAGGLPGSGSSHEFVEFKAAMKAPASKHLRDPGTAAFSMSVRDVDRLLSTMKAGRARVVSTGAEPAVSPNGGRNVFVEDPDGFFLELEGATER